MIAVRSTVVERVPAGPWDQNCYVAAAPSGDAVVIDPGAAVDRIARHIDAGGLRVRAVLATHGHHDHVGAVAELVERYSVPFGIHAAETAVLARVNFHRLAFNGLGPVAMPAPEIDLGAVATLRFGDLELGVLHTPGHTPGGVCFDVGGELLTGDTLLATRPGRSDLPGGDATALAASITALRERYPAVTPLRPGHGEPGTLGSALAAAESAEARQ